ncbi:hypothetical protein FHU38_001776 [Saccharomonospora amisosensis]|uniref:Uncharacterized protein n=1 Tax=Saccharomonospora amisosensis TaxID=1128677 RepID=A0A7X5UNU2_9PSEU|nr:hypothetical protein [Saccharomonospora amisosensis]NIJ11432.1 hypothetical protein [Saccharomonospora amisosensis]
MAKRVLLAQAALLAAGVAALALREFPGLIREVRMWRMASLRRDQRH